MNQPGLTLILVGVVAFFARIPVDRIPGIGGLLSWILLLASVFFVVGGIWMAVVGRKR